MPGFFQNVFGSGSRTTAPNGDLAGPETPSADWCASSGIWRKIDDILAGADRVRAVGGGSVAGPQVPAGSLQQLNRRGYNAESPYLPRYPEESPGEYTRRLANAPWRPEFADALQSLTSRPFRKPVTLSGEVSAESQAIADDIDGCGNNLHVFARSLFTESVAKGMGAILVDFPRVSNVVDGRERTLADDRREANRPYWCHLRAENILAHYSENRGGREITTHVRIRESARVRDGFGEADVDRVRVIELNPSGKPTWTLYQRQESGKYEPIASDELSIDIIPIAFLYTGDRFGNHGVKPPLADLAEMQLELFRALSREDEVLTFAGSPMLAAIGMAKPTDGSVFRVGPKTILFAPPAEGGSDWKYVSPDAGTISAVAANCERTTADFRRLAMQPTVQKSGNITATATSVDASKAHSQVEAWALGLKDTLDRALQFTALWMSVPDVVTASVHTDFAGDVSGVEEARLIGDAQKRHVISKKTERAELQRRNILAPDYDGEEDDLQIAIEVQGLEPEQPIEPTSGKVVVAYQKRNVG